MVEDSSRKTGFKIGDIEDYFNGGVSFVKDDETAHKFYKNWKKNYLECLKSGINTDQQSLVKTNIEMKYPMHRLDDIYNVQSSYGFRYWDKAVVIHYFCSGGIGDRRLFKTQERSLLQTIKEQFKETDKLEEILQNPYSIINYIIAIYEAIERRKSLNDKIQKWLGKLYRLRIRTIR